VSDTRRVEIKCPYCNRDSILSFETDHKPSIAKCNNPHRDSCHKSFVFVARVKTDGVAFKIDVPEGTRL